VITMAIGDSGRHVQSSVPGHGPKDASDQVGKHVRGSGMAPGTGDCAGPSAQADSNRPAPRGDSDNDGM
jgi:hypothetical protein